MKDQGAVSIDDAQGSKHNQTPTNQQNIDVTNGDADSEGNAQQRLERDAKQEHKEWKKKYYEDPVDLHSKWIKLFVTCCVIALFLDPLFFYIPIMDEEKKCLGVDKELRNWALLLRLITDISAIVHSIYRIRKAMKIVSESNSGRSIGEQLSWVSKIFNFIEYVGKIGDQLSWSDVLIDVLAILPIPQLLLVVCFFRMRGSNYWDNIKILNIVLLGQYVVRIFRIYKSFRKVSKRVGRWTRCLLNLFLYLISGHVLGSFWYYFSIQRETSCWHQSCGSNCPRTFYCHEYKNTPVMANLITSLNASCPIDVPYNATAPFDFGIFRDSLKSGNTVSKNFHEKLSFCLWWGLRNLSNFGTNLTTSNYVWENYFAIGISVLGLILFLYLIGNVQVLFQSAITSSLDLRARIKAKEKDFKLWTTKHHDLPENLKREVVQSAIKHLKESKDVDLENLEILFSFLPSHTGKNLKRHLCLPVLSKVPRLQGKHEKVLRLICDNLNPVDYADGKVVFRENEPIDKMIFITDGSMCVFTSPPRSLQKGDYYGDQLIDSLIAASSVPNNPPPTSKETVQCTTKLRGFTLSANDLNTVIKHKLFRNNDSDEREAGEQHASRESIRRCTMSRFRGISTRQKQTLAGQPMQKMDTVAEDNPAEP